MLSGLYLAKKVLDTRIIKGVTCNAMSRTFSAVDLVHLPRIDSNSAVALASSIESASAQFNDLQQTIIDAVLQMTGDRQRLLAALAKTPMGIVTPKEADRRVDRVAGALHDIAEAWGTLAEFLPEGEGAQLIMERVFADGRRFINLKLKEEWAAVETKLATIERENLLPKFEAIGAAPVVALLKQAQSVYGAVIGTTEAIEEAPEVRECKDALLDSIRFYTLQVVATVKRGKPETANRADALLKPLREWESTKPAKEKADPAAPTTGGVISPATPLAGNGTP